MDGLLTQLGIVGLAVLETVVSVSDVIMASPVLLLTMGILLLGGAIGIFGRLLSRN